MLLHLDVEADDFAEELAREILAGNRGLVDTIELLLSKHLEAAVSRAMGNCLIKSPRAIVHPGYFKNRFENLATLSQTGYRTWYSEVRISTRKDAVAEITEIEPIGFELGTIKYTSECYLQFMYSKKELKTQDNHTIRLLTPTLPAKVFTQAIQRIEQRRSLEQPYIANLTIGFQNHVGDRIQGFRVVSFDHVVTGERKFCQCHASVHATMLEEAKDRASSYVEGAWPFRVIALLERASYVEGICHFCVAEQHGEDALVDWYGDQVQKHFEPYVDLLVRGSDMDLRTANAEAKRMLAISRWVRQEELCRLVTKLFPNNKLRREASPEWLGQQRLDIYLPELSLAIEHQGEQHFHSVEGFGGEEAFLRNQERDERKRLLCKENGVTVVDVRYDEPLTLPHLRFRLRRWLPK